MKQYVRRDEHGIIKRPCWVPEGAEVRIDYWMPSERTAPAWVLLEYPVRSLDYRHRDKRLQDLVMDGLKRLNELVYRREEGYFLGLTAAYRAIGPCWQVDFIPDMLPRFKAWDRDIVIERFT